MKKITSILLALVMMLTLVPTVALADPTPNGPVAKIDDTEYASFGSLSVSDGDVVEILASELSNDDCTTLFGKLENKIVTVQGQGKDVTVLKPNINSHITSTKNATFKDMTIVSNITVDRYTASLSGDFDNVKFLGQISTSGKTSGTEPTFKKCDFYEGTTNYNYLLWVYSGSVVCESCHFYDGGNVKAHVKLYGEKGNAITLRMDGCTFDGAPTKQCNILLSNLNNNNPKREPSIGTKATYSISLKDCTSTFAEFYGLEGKTGYVIGLDEDCPAEENNLAANISIVKDNVKVFEYPTSAETPTVDVGGDDVAEVTIEQKSDVVTEGEGVATLEEEVKTKIASNTTVTDVNLTTTAEEGKTSGLQAVVDTAIKKNTELAEAIKDAAVVNVEVKVSVVPTQFEQPNEATLEQVSTVTFELKPTAIVTVGTGDDAKSQEVAVANSMIDTKKPITVSFYTGFEPAKIVHTDDDGFEEVFRPTGDKTFTYNDATKVCTLKISHFSKLTAVDKEYVAQITRNSTTTKYETLAAAIAVAQKDDTITMIDDHVATDTTIIPNGKDITLDLNGHTLDRGLSGKDAAKNGNVITVKGTLKLIDSSSNKTGKITGGNISGGNGGGVYVDGGIFTMESGNITNNKAEKNGPSGVYGGGVYVNSGTFNMKGGNITGNTATSGGGVYVYSSGIFNMNGGNITGNTASYGGGVNVGLSAIFTMSENGKIAYNTATNGGGVYVGGKFNMNGGSIDHNTATTFGGGVLVGADEKLTLGGTAKITDNVYNSTANNVYLMNLPTAKKTFILGTNDIQDRVPEPTGDFKVGVTTNTKPDAAGSSVQITTNGTADAAKYFFSDNPTYYVDFNSSGEYLELRKPGKDNCAINVIPSDHGTVTASEKEAASGKSITLTVTPDKDYQLKAGTLKVTYNNGAQDQTFVPTAAQTVGEYTFTMPAYDVTVTAEFEKISGPEPDDDHDVDYEALAKAGMVAAGVVAGVVVTKIVVDKLHEIKAAKDAAAEVTPEITVEEMPMVAMGSSGDAVTTLQTKLNELGYNCGEVDGVFGQNTYTAVCSFQTAKGLTADGVVGKLTWDALL